MQRRVVVTGVGMLTPLGLNAESTWKALLAGKSGVAPITCFDVSSYPVRFAANVKHFDPSIYFSSKEERRMDLFVQYGLAAGKEAFSDAALQVTEENAPRIGVAVGSGIGGLPSIERNYQALLAGGPRKVSPFFVPGTIINMVSGHLSILFGLKGPNLAMSTACTTGLHCIGEAARIIRTDDADIMLAGGAEMATCPLGLAGFAAARALSTRNDEPTTASRPWDKGRDGFVLGDGAGIVVLEAFEHARRRGARMYAELIGYGTSSDAFHMTAPPETGAGAILSMKNALQHARLAPSDVNYINAHGTSTVLGDLAETRAIKTVYGDHAKKIAISSTKSMMGHLLGAAGAVEAIITILTLHHQVVPPTINLHEPDAECDLDYVPHYARDMTLSVVATNSFGFGGTNGTLIFKQC